MSYGGGDSDGGDSTGGCGCGGGDDSSSSSSGSDASNSGGGYGGDSSNSGGGVGTDGGTDSNDGESGGVGGASDESGAADESNDGGAGAASDGNGDSANSGIQTGTSDSSDCGITGGIASTYSASNLDNTDTYYGTTEVNNPYSFDYSQTELAQMSSQTMEEDPMTQAISQSLSGDYGALDGDITSAADVDTSNTEMNSPYSFDYSQTALAQMSNPTMGEDPMTRAMNQALAEQYGTLDNSVGFVGADTNGLDAENQYSFNYSQTELGKLESMAITRAEELNMVDSYLAQQTKTVDPYAQDFHDFAVNECGVIDIGLGGCSLSLCGDTGTASQKSLLSRISEEVDKTQFGSNAAVCTSDGLIGKAMDVVEESVPNFKTIVASEVKANMGIYNAVTTNALTAGKYVGKYVGFVNVINTASSLEKDYEDYDGDNLSRSIMADVGSGVAGIGVAVIVSANAVGVVGSIVGGTFVAGLLSYTVNTFKSRLSKKN